VHVRRRAAGVASGWPIVGCHNRVGGISWLECYHRWRGGVVPSAEHTRLHAPQARGLSRGRQPGHSRPAADATWGTAVVGELEVAAGLARQSPGVGEADFQLRCGAGAGARGRRRTRRRCGVCRRGRGRCRAGRVLAGARGYDQPARRHGQDAVGDLAVTDCGSGEPTVDRRSCLRITGYVKPHSVSLHLSEAYRPEMRARPTQQRRRQRPTLARLASSPQPSALGSSVIADSPCPLFRVIHQAGHRLR